MAIFDIKLPNRILKALRLPQNNPRRQQIKVLKKLLRKARFTAFGQQYRFDEILLCKHPGKKFQELVPTFNYNKIHQEWWHKTLEGIPDICWPGKIRYYALSSGTSEAASKYIPVTNDLLSGNKLVMIRQLFSLRNYENIPYSSIGKGWLTLGGSTDLQKEGPGYYAGDLSGITQKKAPFWFQPFYKPGKKIAKQKDWNKKLEEIVDKAPDWDIGFIVGVPAWIQMCMEMVIQRYKLNHIHEMWPNLAFFVHGGVSFEPYKIGFEKLLGKPITYIETYLASEGFIAYQDRQFAKGMRLVTSEHIFMEFVPFDDTNFNADGEMIDNPEALMIHEVEEGKDYALLISTSAGTWRYLIGDTVRFVDKDRCEIVITGRTKHFLSLVGEHLSVDNMNKAIQLASEKMNISIPEFTVAGVPYESFFAHHWYVACDDTVDKKQLLQLIDGALKELNDDYAVERKSALKEVFLDVLSEHQFMEFMRSKGKVGGQHKFPRVLKGKMLEDWQAFLKKELVTE
ncbi:MAG: GH3 auxin-responsive promoter family protein [Sediminibacterium sp.]|uniref:GH3 family domain-containing protein n=1 Tax=Sediminibacterium sp. TaxID=1917865 RepID=UPI002ABAC891|nr:GH3 auxin-responsive promoter family protein [Sediminibacterium sp.]MDZ4071964.1 GH3 auxin-responsive promoter family protein [Sediminibacterium sp.]